MKRVIEALLSHYERGTSRSAARHSRRLGNVPSRHHCCLCGRRTSAMHVASSTKLRHWRSVLKKP